LIRLQAAQLTNRQPPGASGTLAQTTTSST
jgi:hypothetical protein